MKRRKRGVQSWWSDERGIALIAVLLTVVVLAILGVAMLGFSTTDSTNATRMARDLQALYAADAGVENVVNQLWADYVAQDCNGCPLPKGPSEIGDLNTYIAFLDGLGVPNDGSVWTPPGVKGMPLAGGGAIQQVEVTRSDFPTGVTLAVTSRGSARDKQVTVQETIWVGGRRFEGFEYGLFAENVNCTMCHARFDSAERYYNTDPSLEGTFERVKVATLGTLQIRPTEANTIIAGTLYTTGTLQDDNGNPLADLATTTLDGYDFDTNGKITEAGGLQKEDLTKAAGDPLSPLENLYIDYPVNPAGQVDGELPAEFIMPFPDEDGDRLVDDSEFSGVAGKATGAVTGGILYGVPPGKTYSNSGLPGSSSFDLSRGLDKSYAGNLILVGTDADPITCSGNVAVDGDVVIAGKVMGECAVVARGNIYVVGDTTYADGTDKNGDRTFGVAADGKTKNGLALVAGKNIVIGDHLTTQEQDLSDRAQVDPGRGVFPPPCCDKGGGPIYRKTSFTTAELALFNKTQYEKAQADPSYTPRYYQLRDGDPIYRYGGTGEKGTRYDTELFGLLPGPGDAVVSLSPTATGGTPWMSETQLKEMWIADNHRRPATGAPAQLDALLYSSNAIIALSRGMSKGSKKDGQMILNGALVAPDIGILVPGKDANGKGNKGVGLQLNYDRRLARLVRLSDPGSQVALVRRGWTVK